MPNLTILERRDLRLVAAQNEVDALHAMRQAILDDHIYLVSFVGWQVSEVTDRSPDETQYVIQKMQELDFPFSVGPRLFAVSAHYEVKIYVESPTNDPGLAGESGMPVASDGERKS